MSVKNDDLSERRKEFCRMYVITLNGAEAARRAGYSASGAAEEAARLLRDARVKNEIARLRAERHIDVEKEDIVAFLVKLISAPIDIFHDDKGKIKPLSEIPLEYQCYIEQVTRKGGVAFKIMSKADAIAKLSRLKHWEKEASVNVFVGLPDDEIDRKIKELQAEIDRAKLAETPGE